MWWRSARSASSRHWRKDVLGFVPWNLYSLASLIIIAGLTHVPHVYLYTAAALRGLSTDLEEAARVTGANPLRVAINVSLPMVLPAILFAGVLVFFLGFELFGLPLVLGDPQGLLVLSTYLYKLTNKLGVPSYQLMAVVVVAIIAVTAPLVFMQRLLLRQAQRYVSVRGKGLKTAPLRLGTAGAGPPSPRSCCWCSSPWSCRSFGITLRSFVDTWGEGVKLLEVLTLDHYRELIDYPNVVRGIINTLRHRRDRRRARGGLLHRHRARDAPLEFGLDAAGRLSGDGAARHAGPRRRPRAAVGVPVRAVPVAAASRRWSRSGSPIRSSGSPTACGSSPARCCRSAPELEEAARTAGASDLRVKRDVTVPLIKYGMLASWLLIFLIFVREYSTGIYLLGPGTEVIGSLLVSLWGTGAIDLVSALSVVNVVMIGVGLAVAIRLGVRLHG